MSVWLGITGADVRYWKAVTICACGGPDSGKTHTIRGSQDDPGIVPRVIDMLFQGRQEGDYISLSMVGLCCNGSFDLLQNEESQNVSP